MFFFYLSCLHHGGISSKSIFPNAIFLVCSVFIVIQISEVTKRQIVYKETANNLMHTVFTIMREKIADNVWEIYAWYFGEELRQTIWIYNRDQLLYGPHTAYITVYQVTQIQIIQIFSLARLCVFYIDKHVFSTTDIHMSTTQSYFNDRSPPLHQWTIWNQPHQDHLPHVHRRTPHLLPEHAGCGLHRPGQVSARVCVFRCVRQWRVSDYMTLK